MTTMTTRSRRGRTSLFVDTSGWASLFDADQEFHQETTEVYRRAQSRRRQFVTTNYIITELVALLETRTRIPRERMIAFIDGLKAASDVEIVHISAEQDAKAWELLKSRQDKEWSLVDSSSFVLMTERGVTEALTTDHHFLQAGFVRLPQQNA